MKHLDGIRSRDMEGVVPTAELRRGGVRDLALIGLARDGMLRPREIPVVAWDHIQFLRDGTAELAVPLPDGTWGMRPVAQSTSRWLAALLEDGAPPDLPMFPLTTSQINRRVSALCAAAGLVWHYGASSPRIGMAQDLADAGTTVEELRAYGRWRGLEAPWEYVRRSRSYQRLHSGLPRSN